MLARVRDIVPDSYSLVRERARQKDWSLQAGVHFRDFTSMEAIADHLVFELLDLAPLFIANFLCLLAVLHG